MKKTHFLRLWFALIVCAVGWGTQAVHAQTTIKVMQYNLLRYGASGIGGCTPTGVTARNSWFSAILNHTQPDILGVNEIGPVEGVTAPATNILNNILKPINSAYERAQVTFDGSQDIANCLFYNSQKLGLKSQAVIPQSFRHINYYKLFYKGPGLVAGDTTWLEVVVVHLSADNASIRSAQTTAIMNYLCGLNRPGNFLVMGDFNLDSSSETSYQNMISNPDVDCKMNDPIGLAGTWTNNTNAKHAWTQSTRSSSGSDCGSGGGLDDRFDFILCSSSVMNNSADIRYVPSSYRVVGNPYAPNPSVPSNVASALSPMSDHYPVMLDLEVSQAVSVHRPSVPNPLSLKSNPVDQVIRLDVQVAPEMSGSWNIKVMDAMGKMIYQDETQFSAGLQTKQIPSFMWPNGIYLLEIEEPGGYGWTSKVSVAH
jgi:hypothetical protein